MKTVTRIAERLVLSKKEQRCIEELSRLRTEFSGILRNTHSVITFYLESLLPESIYCYALFCTEAERKVLKNYVISWHWIRPSLSGNDLMEMGVVPGPKMKDVLAGLRSACIDQGLQPEDEAEWVKSFLERNAE